MKYKDVKKLISSWKETEQHINRCKTTMMVENSNGRMHHTLKNCNNIKAVVNKEDIAINLYLNNNYNCIMLDYNLSRIWNIFKKENTLKLAHTIANDIDVSLKLIVIHSWNPIGRRKLYNILKEHNIDIIVCRHKRIF